jgi:cytoskeletal protein CcmA (bactofilin family)
MFKPKDAGSPDNVDTLIGANSTFEGNIESQGTIRVDGKVKGDLKVGGDVFIGSKSQVTGNIFASNVFLSGTVEGNIEASGVLRLLSTAKLLGDIKVHSFVADEGGVFQGKCCMLDIPRPELVVTNNSSKKNTSKDYKKSSMLDQIYEEKEKSLDA